MLGLSSWVLQSSGVSAPICQKREETQNKDRKGYPFQVLELDNAVDHCSSRVLWLPLNPLVILWHWHCYVEIILIGKCSERMDR